MVASVEQAYPKPNPPAWVRDAVFYQIFPDRFRRSGRVPAPGPLEPWDAPPTSYGFKGGDLYGVVDRLDHLEALGVTAIYLTPIFASASNHRYHAYDYLAVDPLLGGNDALRTLLDAAHARGMRVILDGVFNHAGRGFWPFHHVLETGRQSPYRDWFHLDADALDAGMPVRAYPTEELLAAMAAENVPVATRTGEVSRRHLGYRAWWDLPALPKLNTANPQMREYLLQVGERWLEFGADGWRLDVPMEVEPDFWVDFRARCRRVRPDAYLVGEIWRVRPDWVAGDRFDGLMNYPLAEAILGFVGGSRLDMAVIAQHHEIAAFLQPLDAQGFAARLRELLDSYPPEVVAAQLNLLDSHDMPRALTICGGDRTALRLGYLLLATLPGAPCIYYGDEVGVEGEHDPDCRRSLPDDPADWDHDLLGFIRSAFRLRHGHAALRSDDVRVAHASEDAIALARGDSALVAVNAGDEPARLALPDGTGGWAFATLDGTTWSPASLTRDAGHLELGLSPRSGAVLVRG